MSLKFYQVKLVTGHDLPIIATFIERQRLAKGYYNYCYIVHETRKLTSRSGDDSTMPLPRTHLIR